MYLEVWQQQMQGQALGEASETLALGTEFTGEPKTKESR